jgi:L-rhamnose 1-dehydrogenase
MGMLDGKVAAITGGVTGIGRAIALRYLAEGAKVVVNHLGDEESAAHFKSLVQEASPEAKCIDVAGDISLYATGQTIVKKAVAAFGALDIFVSNAGICQFSGFLEIEPDLFQKTVDTNLSGAFYAIQAAARQMVSQGRGGSIIGISSISALVGVRITAVITS